MCKNLYGMRIVLSYDKNRKWNEKFEGIVISSDKNGKDIRIFKKNFVSNRFKFDFWITVPNWELSTQNFESGKDLLDFLVNRAKDIAKNKFFEDCEIAIDANLAAYIEKLDSMNL